tara:strand:- start:1640 stop:1747 length:108 start_codon:yes stop_codon:yes gene_type:complete
MDRLKDIWENLSKNGKLFVGGLGVIIVIAIIQGVL